MDDKKILNELRGLLTAKFPGIIEKVILYGSRATGKPNIFSDHDVLIILKSSYDWRLKQLIQEICWEIDYKYDILTDVKVISLAELQTIKGKQPYITDAMQYGVAI